MADVMRPDKDLYFLTIAKAVALRSTCRSWDRGCVLVDKNYHIVSTGYNGPANGQPACDPCYRLGAKSGEGLELCVAIHAEQNALLQCPDTTKIFTAYITVSPCLTCTKLLMNTSCQRIVYLGNYPHIDAAKMWTDLGREWIQYVPNAGVAEILSGLAKIREFCHISSPK